MIIGFVPSTASTALRGAGRTTGPSAGPKRLSLLVSYTTLARLKSTQGATTLQDSYSCRARDVLTYYHRYLHCPRLVA